MIKQLFVSYRPRTPHLIFLAVLMLPLATLAQEPIISWGNMLHRNMVFPGENLPVELSESNLLWKTELDGNHLYSQPAIVGDKLLVGFVGDMQYPIANGEENESKHSQVLCLDRGTGEILWRIGMGYSRYGVCATFTIEDDRVYFINNTELHCADLNGMADGNDGDQTELEIFNKYRRRRERNPDAIALPEIPYGDILWTLGMKEMRVDPEDAASGTPLLLGDQLWVTTSNSRGQRPASAQQKQMPEQRPEPNPDVRIPNIVVVDKLTGELIAKEDHPPLEVYHGQWSSLAAGEVDGQMLVFWGDGYGIVHAYMVPDCKADDGSVQDLQELWRLDGVPHHYRFDEQGNERLYPATSPGKHITDEAFQEIREFGSGHFISTPVFHEGKLFVALGRDRNYCDKSSGRADGAGVITCINPAGEGDITETNILWQNTNVGRFHATPSIQDGLMYIAGTDGIFYCLDITDGAILYKHDLGASVCDRSQLFADGKIYVTNDKAELWVFQAGRELNVLHHDDRTFKADLATPLTAGDTVYLANKERISAYRQSAAEPAVTSAEE
jgi:outer membrane protein assembly factor BamB